MSKSKVTSKTSKAADKVLSKVKDAGVTKPAQSPKATSKQIARKLKEKEEKSSKKKKKEPTPSSDSSSESDSDEEMDSASSSESESEDEKPAKKATKAEDTKAAAKKDESSESESESEESESSESEEEAPAKATKAAEESDAEESDSDSEGSSDESESEEESDESTEAPKKRKAEEEPAANAKKAKTEAADNSPNLFVGNLSWNVDEEWLRREFEEFGELNGVRIMTERDSGRSRGFGYVEFADASSAKAAYEGKKDAEIDGRTINLDYAKPRDTTNQAPREKAQTRARSFGDQTSPESNTLFLGNLSFSVDENAVREVFQDQGDIRGIRLPTDAESGRPKGYGYVEFSSVDEARQALNALNGTEIGGRAIRLDFSSPRPQGDGNRGGRGGRGGFGGRGGARGGRGSFGGRGRGGATGANATSYSGKKTTFD